MTYYPYMQPPGPQLTPGSRRLPTGVVVFLVGVLVVVVAVAAFLLGRNWPTGGGPVTTTSSTSTYGIPTPAPMKPVIYLYPEQTTDVTVQLSHADRLTASYPAYGDGWQVTAHPDGSLVDQRTGRALYALYYEGGRQQPAQRTGEGFVVPGAQTASFLEWALAELGLNQREAEEFIIYWLPVLQGNPYTYIRFESLAEQAAVHELIVTPEPDVVIRVMMDWQRLDAPETVTPQRLTAPDRRGFVVVEWGGTPI